MARTITRADLPILANRLAELADRLADDGYVVWRRLEEWRTGPRAANYDPDGGAGWRYDAQGEPIPSDPTGEAALIVDDPGRELDEFRADLALLDEVTARIANRVGGATPGRLRKPRKATPDDVAADGWCRSCYRVDEYLEPSADRYADLCRFCGDWRAAHPEHPEPPAQVLRWRRQGRRITPAMVTAALKPPVTKRKKRKR